VIAKLEKDPEYVAAFGKHYGGKITSDNIQNAIAAFEKTLVTRNSKFDKHLMGQADALTADEKEGYHLFKEHACATCHVGKALGGQSYELMGHLGDYFGDRGDVIKPDHGRFNFTNDEADRHKFKVPTLRNVALTYPYFHDGSTTDLKEAVLVMSKYQTGRTMSDAEAEKVTTFLKTLTGEYEGKLLQ
jgi:cytochrome c peroxidase